MLSIEGVQGSEGREGDAAATALGQIQQISAPSAGPGEGVRRRGWRLPFQGRKGLKGEGDAADGSVSLGSTLPCLALRRWRTPWHSPAA